MVFLSIKLN